MVLGGIGGGDGGVRWDRRGRGGACSQVNTSIVYIQHIQHM